VLECFIRPPGFLGSSAELVGNYGLKRGSSQSIQGVKRQG
jgi:hypothetical protein